ncbi:AMP-binding protein [Ruminococcus sp.]|jgi:acetyl-CoA synthetase|uniref:AMP-binding protein n=1 Tax=Ruminococcus sp. TaxID=41978 RepID=UPI0026319548|nr:AMP-binding protein [Ruminococcus sp.]MCI2111923.1 AMP-binding protein [Ruminococcus sp.]MDD6988248.1 AMP-binding protein [Ruminococcus sp.]MDY6201724.1 AMP-binding protein [Ruminococcus sp.]
MQLYKNFCKETLDENGNLLDFELDFPENYNFGYDVVDKMAELAPDDIAVVWTNPDKEEKTFTFADISRLSNKAANVFRNNGIKKGDKVLVILKRNYEYWYVAPALHKLGAIIIPATHLLTQSDISYRVDTANITAAVCTPDDSTADDLMAVASQPNTLEKVFVCRKKIFGTIDFTTEVENADDTLERVDTKAEEPMLIYFTSGTTGYPKAVEHNHTYTLGHIVTAKYWQCVKENGLHLTVAETGWGKASWGKIYGQWLCGCGVMVYDFDKFSPGKLLRIIERYKVTSFCAPPTVYRYFIKRGMDKYDLSALEHLTTAGEALNGEVFEKVFEQTGIHLMEGFGQTESVLMLANLKGSVAKPGSMGKPTPLYDVHIIDDSGKELGANETGEIVVYPPKDKKQYGIFMSYYGNEDLYKNVWKGGVYHTGDTAYKDEDGYYWYVGRADDLIKTRGFRVGPFEVENVIMQYPNVLECAVIGVPDKDRGQAIKAIVKLADGTVHDKHTESEIKTFCNKRMASYKWIQHLEIVDEFPKTISGKIKRTTLREESK